MVVLVIGLGLASRRFSAWLPGLLQKNLGDILWATMVYFALGALLPRLSQWRLAGLACGFSLAIELSKFLHAPWFDAIRATAAGRLVFGYVFSWSNLACYLAGIALRVAWEAGVTALSRRQSGRRSSARAEADLP